MGLSVAEVCLYVFKGKYNSYHVQGVSGGFGMGLLFSITFYPDALMHSCTVRNQNVKLLSTSWG